MASFVKQMSLTFGKAIRPAPLRYAILAYSTLRLPQEQLRHGFEDYLRKAKNELWRRVNMPDKLQDADVFAAMILAWVSLCKGLSESATHAHGGLSMLDCLSGVRKIGSSSDLLALFAPLIRDNMSSILTIGGGPPPIIASGPSTILPRPVSVFTQRVNYYRELCRTGTPAEAWQPTEVETTYNYLRGAVGFSIRGLKSVAIMERDRVDRIERTQAINHISVYIQGKLEDDDFRRMFAQLGESFRRHQSHGTDSRDSKLGAELQVLRFLSMGIQALELLRSIFEGPGETIKEGFGSHRTAVLAARLHSVAQSTGHPLEALKYYRDIFYCSLSLCGILLSPIEPYECKIPLSVYILMTSCLANKSTGRMSDVRNSKMYEILVDV